MGPGWPPVRTTRCAVERRVFRRGCETSGKRSLSAGSHGRGSWMNDMERRIPVKVCQKQEVGLVPGLACNRRRISGASAVSAGCPAVARAPAAGTRLEAEPRTGRQLRTDGPVHPAVHWCSSFTRSAARNSASVTHAGQRSSHSTVFFCPYGEKEAVFGLCMVAEAQPTFLAENAGRVECPSAERVVFGHRSGTGFALAALQEDSGKPQ